MTEGEVKIVAPDPQLCEARGAGLNDMFSFHKHGPQSPGGAKMEGKEGLLEWTGQTGSAKCKGQSFQLSSDTR